MIGVIHATPSVIPPDAFSLFMPILLAFASIAYLALGKMLGAHFQQHPQQTFSKNCFDSLVKTFDAQCERLAIAIEDRKIQSCKPTPPVIPMVSLRPGDKTHDKEYRENQDKFLLRCHAEAGPIFKLLIHRLEVTVISDHHIREMFHNENFSNVDALNELMGVKTFLHSLIKSGKNNDSRIQNSIILEHLTPNLGKYQAEIVEQFEEGLRRGFGENGKKEGNKKRTLCEDPTNILQDMIGRSTGTVFMGPKVANNPKVLDTFIMSMHDFARVLGLNDINIPFWRRWLNIKLNHFNNPLKHRVRTLAEAANPIIIERRRREQDFIDHGNSHDICGHIMLLILTSVHTTIDASSAMVYYLAAYPETIPVLHREQVQVLDAIQHERQQERDALLAKGHEIGPDLDPSNDRDLTTAALKRMVHLDSFQREVLRCRTEALTHFHMARKETVLSNGMIIPKYGMLLANLTSTHSSSTTHSPNPSEFHPWSHVGTFKTATKVGVNFLPFGMGKHVCPGRFMATQQTKSLVSLMVSKFEIIEFQDPTQAGRVLRMQHGDMPSLGLIFTDR
ncbi:hypothetical protein BGZ95_009752 [Linnemannia exigua]|uniref:Cytochrome P450 n=1 Tax=Linnemannia exigua TaxID=604196 RepID=A0AAD4DMA9_9FUNG|nr:hypothetical protein BGZ95_009752 [Linnemannia exigua]